MSDSKRRILDASLKLFAEEGYASTSMSDIADTVGIRKSSLYSHFKNKEALFETVLEGIIQRHGQAIDKLLHSLRNESPLVQLERYFIEYIDYCRNNIEVDFWIRFYYFPPSTMADSILSKTQKSEGKGQKELLSMIEEGISQGEIKPLAPEDIMFTYYQLLMGFLMSLNDYKTTDPKPDMQRCLNLFFAGIRTQ